jgi:hypothetical protein
MASIIATLALALGQAGAQQIPGQTVPQSPYNPPYATITYPAADPTTQSTTVFTPAAGNRFALVGLQPGQAVNVVVQYPTDQALQIVSLTTPDGGILLPPNFPGTIGLVPNPGPIASPTPAPSPPVPITYTVSSIPISEMSLVISVDGSLSFTFVAGNEPGRYGIALRLPGNPQSLTLQFYALDPQDTQQNPGCITADNPDF